MDKPITIVRKVTLTTELKTKWPDDYQGMSYEEAIQYERQLSREDVLEAAMEATEIDLQQKLEVSVVP